MKEKDNLLQENAELKARLDEAEELLEAIKSGAVDAFVTDDQKVFTLKGADQAYRVLVETMNEGAATLAFDGTVMYCNSRLAEMLKCPLEKLISGSILDFVIPDEFWRLKSILRDSKNKTVRQELWFKKTNEQLFPVIVSCSSLEPDGVGLCMVITDLTEQKHNELQLKMYHGHLEELIEERTCRLRDSEERFKLAVAGASAGVWDWDIMSGKAWWSPRFYELLGFKNKEIEASLAGFKEMIHPDDREATFDMVSAHFKGEKPFSIEYRLKTKSGEYKWFLGTGQVKLDEKKKPVQMVGTNVDISERKHAEEKLRQSEAKFRSLFEHSPDAIFLAIPGGAVTNANPAACTMFGMTEEELCRVGRRGIEYPADPRHDAAVKERARSGMVRYEATHVRKDGSTFPSEVSSVIVDGGLRSVVILRDITERKRAEEALAAAHRQTQDIIDNTPAIVYAFDLEERFMMANATVAKLLNSTPDQLIGKRRHDFMPQTDADWHEANDRKVIEEGRALDFEEQSELPGRSITWLTTKFPLRDAEGKIYAVGGFSTDITERKRAEAELVRTKMLLETLLTQAPVGFTYIDRELRYVMINEQLAVLNGLPAAAHLGKHVGDIVPMLLPAVLEVTGRILATGQPVKDHEFSGETAAQPGVTRYWNESWYPVCDGAGAIVGFGAVIGEITERKRIEELLKRDEETMQKLVQEQASDLVSAKLELERAKRLSDIGVLASTVAHELRNPLAAITITADILRRKAKNLDVENLLGGIEMKVAESDQIINNLLYYSRIKPPHREKIDISPILEECIELIEDKSNKDMSIIKNIDSIKEISIEADPIQIREVFNNLLNNAIDAIPSEGGIIKIIAESKDGFIKVAVEDNGEGIPKNKLEKIFDPFFTTKAKGTGLGLSVCRQIIDFHNGSIHVESEEGHGTTFIVSLPKK
ncbi:MAG TPA: hypothetical protein DET40_11660 [Lentisphaeria bacterium]|nr:MAG: hypothetical protein A2X45_24950 [Lentisphaerae bacterium GWF2_50_93]HCE44194.1 hypothetical protein [Lentisphaeria bacterium]